MRKFFERRDKAVENDRGQAIQCCAIRSLERFLVPQSGLFSHHHSRLGSHLGDAR